MNNGQEVVNVSPEKGAPSIGIDIENQRQFALTHPRREKQIYEEALNELDLVPEFASKAYYSIPYKNDMGGITYVEGPSIKSAMALARRWGNCVNATRIAEEKDDRIIVEGAFLDLQTGTITMRQYSVSRGYWSKQTKRVVPLREDRLNMAIQSGMSKAVRGAILATLPVGLVEAYTKKAKMIASKTLGPAKPGMQKIQDPRARLGVLKEKFIKLGVTDTQWNEYLDGSSVEPDELIARLIGLYSAIEDGSAKIEDVFGSPEAPEATTGQIKSADLFGGKK